MRLCFFLLLFFVSASQVQGQESDTFSVYFPMDARQLTTSATQEIDSLFYADWLHTSSQVEVIGYADYVGGAGAYNDELSKKRAQNVAQYLKENGIRPGNIRLILGKGAVIRNQPAGYEGFAPDRRVDIVCRHKPGAPPAEAPKPEPPSAVRTRPKAVDTPFHNITQLKENDVLRLENIYFYPGRHVVRPESYPAMEQLLKSLKEHSTIKVRIEGHICCVNNAYDGLDFDTNELALSSNRARFIYDWLIQNGISKERLEWKGFGHSRPLIPVERSEADANRNRRVEIRILGK